MSYRWDKRLARYRDDKTGRFLSEKRIDELTAESIKASQSAVDELARMVSAGEINTETWKRAMRQEIKGEYIRQYVMQRGGREMMTSADWGSVGGMIADQYKYLDNFADQVGAGELSEGQIAMRSRMYANSAREGASRAQGRAKGDAGYQYEEWVNDPASDNCQTCVSRELEGIVPIGTHPPVGDGSTECKTNCTCHKTYYKEKP